MTDAAPALPATVPVAVIGAGTMGSGIALVAARAGHPVLLHDAAPGAIQRGLDGLRRDLDRLVDKGRLAAAERDAQLGRITAMPRLDDIGPAGLVIEAIVEDFSVKRDLFRRVEAAVAPDAILSTNTSSLSVTALAAVLDRPERFLGVHFFNPAPILPLVEIVSGHVTAPAVAATAFATCRAWGKTPVHCRSTPGFIVNRVARPFYGETLRLIAEGAATPATLDAILREAGGFRMGPCELMDLIGHDVNYAVTRTVWELLFQDPRYKPSLVQKELVEAGQLGRKTGRGFYDYAKGAPPPAPDDAPAGPRPTSVVIEGDLGPAAALPALAEAAGLTVTRRDGPGLLRIDGVALALTDGRSATARFAADGGPEILFDLALDYATAGRIAIAAADQAPAGACATAAGFFQALGKTVSVLDDAPGLAVMRTVAMLVNEAADAAHQRVGSVADIDLSMLKGVNYPRGPLAWCDTLGAARITAVIDALAAAYGEDRYRTAPLLRRHALTGRPFHPSN
ncbi:3-hydroxyacyl-CoA dehydrogenase PaaC [Rhodoplanes sp. TEM]|uniref:3-hydroxyacyl-CoA dehydrogenase PaaC n=1 Tax=Rhodoplanes tepidamans TaxID=200616 RepID=A0ABT5J8D5_RHOTP|nr:MULTISPECIES: 3-hydroxyacyl-CoA dehydrogenase PaaH [Rhodoplanes]MDC7785315.1 3-hydroxyacyl-CoA dehydrogenase PaaC [Rhodoplanes tepidamans]MDC7987280.1 3-hydroxyacyl-CoA dehydrogenase PaaC [Rhodoplanes sp. TEM]MDQ0353574.1 3-hydroxybutyryl-CoA dehydrogenase [Rhodoplanes tepidamans]